ncbi:MFS transporter [Metallosphaera hakonensis]|uniref:MFS transporter n=1 Tax=Metallosphaera hakonensis JCM 8857 = DSM 7519 TaxID=1293036 RepID=A0A2U9IW85_9CREN|nr:MFS transporter [Metallosphaera hakonensis]AWS00342.1 MFS transporter [Metallosphaera hakonensis JCM 8857 = DSM 7519]
MRPLRTYAILKSIATDLAQPFITFTAASSGIVNEYLGVISSASTVLTAVSEFTVALTRVRAMTLLYLGNVVSGLSWIILSLLPFTGPYLTFLYCVAELGLGMSIMGWNLIMEKLSSTSRGEVLTQYTAYANVGGLIATLGAGIFVGSSANLIKIPFILSGVITLFTVLVLRHSDVDYEDPAREFRLPRGIWNFLSLTTIFTFFWSFAWPLFPLAQIYIFHMNYINIAIISFIAGISSLIFRRKVAVLITKNRRMAMFLGRALLMVFPLSYALAPNVYYIYLAEVVAGFTSMVGSTAYISYLYDNSRKEDMKVALGFYSVVQGIGALSGSVLSSYILNLLVSVLGLITDIKVLLLTSAILRLATSFWYLKLRELKS